MLRGDNIVCGTTTTGTGTLTLAATPGPPGGIDFDVFARTTGIGFGNSATVLVSYTIIEYTDTTFATALATEKGVGLLTLGGSSGIANCTLARTTKQTSATSLNSQPATQNIAPATGISIGTAANTLVFIGASAAETMGCSPYFQSGIAGQDANAPVGPAQSIGNPAASSALTTALDYYLPFIWLVPMLAKRCTMRCSALTAGNSNVDARLYNIGTDGKPSKLLYDFGLFGTTNTSLSATGNITTGAAGNGFYLIPGEYFLDVCVTFASGTPTLQATGITGPLFSGRGGSASMAPYTMYSATGGTIGAAPDPANVAGWAVFTNMNRYFSFGFSPS